MSDMWIWGNESGERMTRKWNLPLTYEPKIQPVIDGAIRQTIRTGRKFSIGDLVRFYTWQGRPYHSKRETITEYIEIKTAFPLMISPEGFYYDIPTDRTLAWWGSIYGQALATLDGIVSPSGQHLGVALRDVLICKNKIPKEGIEAQIIRW